VMRVVDGPRGSSRGSVAFHTTADPERFSEQLRELLGVVATPDSVEL